MQKPGGNPKQCGARTIVGGTLLGSVFAWTIEVDLSLYLLGPLGTGPGDQADLKLHLIQESRSQSARIVTATDFWWHRQ